MRRRFWEGAVLVRQHNRAQAESKSRFLTSPTVMVFLFCGVFLPLAILLSAVYVAAVFRCARKKRAFISASQDSTLP